MAVFAIRVAREQLRDTLFACGLFWSVKMAAFIWADVDLQLLHSLILLPFAAIGHLVGLKLHQRLLQAETAQFFRVLGVVLLVISLVGLVKVIVNIL